jgi:hypothetical protein
MGTKSSKPNFNLESAENRVAYLYHSFVEENSMTEPKQLELPLKNATIPVVFLWKTVQPDCRKWKPSLPVLELEDTKVVVDVPATKEYIYNLDNYALRQDIAIELTPKGMRYCIDQLELVMSDPAKPDLADDEFETSKTETHPANANIEEDDEWA